MASKPQVIVGIDLGTLSTKITLGSTHDHELVRNAHGGHDTPSAVTFAGKHRARLIGEDAADVSRADGNTVGMLDRLLVGSLKSDGEDGETSDPLAPYQRFQVTKEDGEKKVNIPAMEEDFSSTALVAMLLGKIKKNVISTIDRLEGTSSNGSAKSDSGEGNSAAQQSLKFVFSVPPSYPEVTRNALMDAAYAASVEDSVVVDSTDCMAALYERKFGDSISDSEKKIVLVVDMGHARTCVSILQAGGAAAAETGGAETMDVDPMEENSSSEEEKKSKEPDENMTDANETTKQATPKVQLLSTVSSPTLGAGVVNTLLYHHFLSTHPSLSNAEFKPNSRPGQRLLSGCNELKKKLSMLADAKVTVENIGKNDTDVSLSANRDTLRQLCEEEVLQKLKGLLQSAIDNANGVEIGDITSVELSGGGCRIPMVQDTIREAIGKGDDFTFARSFDDTSLALGAAMLASSDAYADVNMSVEMSPERIARRDQLLKDEVAMEQRDVQLHRKDEIRNQIESHILELRSAKHSSAHSSLLPTSEEFNTHLDGTDDWLFTDECEEASVEQMEEKWQQIQARTNELCGDYLAAKKAEAEKKDREMEEEAKRGAAEREAEAAMNGEEDDHDNRRLPTKRRMEIVMKNKAEANELFSGKNYRHAAARYSKALTHCTKFYDLSPQEEQEVKDVKLSLHLNLALSYIKLEKLDNAYQSCNDALSIDSTSVKALYRRATVQYEKRKFDDSLKDLKEAEKLAPDDKAVKKLRKMVDQQMAKQKAKEKAMAKKMFG